ncbi:MAG TPA: ABC transporter substrate-binding protein [bacterium]|nr:ABC transporter substrate-binding protein [bacterium]
MRRFLAILVVAILALPVITTGLAAQTPVVVRVATLKLVGGAPIFWGIHQNYFGRQGIRVEPVYFGAAAPVATAVATGDTEVGATGITGTLFNLAAGGAKVWLVADRGQERPGYHLNSVVVTKASYDAGIHTLRDLKGKRIGVTTLGSTFDYQIGEMLDRVGLAFTDVKLVPLREVDLLVQAVRTGQVDAAILSPPWGTASEEQGWGKVLFWVGDKITNQVTGVFYGEKLHQDRALGVRFMKGYILATRDYYDACLAKPPHGSCDAIVGVTASALDQSASSVRESLPYIDRNARLYTLDLQRQEAWYLQHGMITQVIPLEQFVDTSFITEALRQLGP